MRVGLAQVDTCVGDLEGNVAVCAAAAQRAAKDGADLVVLPELAVTGCPPLDILFDESFVSASFEATRDLARRVGHGPPVVVGTIAAAAHRPRHHPGLLNAAALLQGGEVWALAGKRSLPSHDVFHEPRWFVPGPSRLPIDLAGRRLGVLHSDDLDDEHAETARAAELVRAGADLLVVLAASPFRAAIQDQRLRMAARPSVPVVWVNACGATDDLIFDGRSFVLDGAGRLLRELPGFAESVAVVDLPGAEPGPAPSRDLLSELRGALVLGIRDFVHKNRLGRAFLGLSGGVDSAVVAVLARDALGAERVTALALPSRYTDPRSTEAARELAERLGIGFEAVPLEPLHAAAEHTLAGLLTSAPAASTLAENIQARLRMVILMAWVNRHGGLLLNTTNKTELALGYGTLYGDTAGTLCPIADLTKTEVMALARFLGEIPGFVLERTPTAELRPGQVDPFDYPTLAPRLEQMIRAHASDAALRRSEHKRRGMGVILKVSEVAFGPGRLLPITRR